MWNLIFNARSHVTMWHTLTTCSQTPVSTSAPHLALAWCEFTWKPIEDVAHTYRMPLNTYFNNWVRALESDMVWAHVKTDFGTKKNIHLGLQEFKSVLTQNAKVIKWWYSIIL